MIQQSSPPTHLGSVPCVTAQVNRRPQLQLQRLGTNEHQDELSQGGGWPRPTVTYRPELPQERPGQKSLVLLHKPRLPFSGNPEKVTENGWEENCFTNRKLVLVLKSRSRQFLRQNVYYLLKRIHF